MMLLWETTPGKEWLQHQQERLIMILRRSSWREQHHERHQIRQQESIAMSIYSRIYGEKQKDLYYTAVVERTTWVKTDCEADKTCFLQSRKYRQSRDEGLLSRQSFLSRRRHLIIIVLLFFDHRQREIWCRVSYINRKMMIQEDVKRTSRGQEEQRQDSQLLILLSAVVHFVRQYNAFLSKRKQYKRLIRLTWQLSQRMHDKWTVNVLHQWKCGQSDRRSQNHH